ncbi:MAG: D-2-hydroxyacid dehydrogenase [Saprospiraceae bacterium]|nr:D-2-hydroxyacid dehydrogenase [Saprospiraceae bacterium]
MKIVHLDTTTTVMDGISLSPLDQFENFVAYPSTKKTEVIERAKDADIVIVNKVVLDEETISQLPNLKYICVSATGYNNVDTDEAKKKGIPVSNVSGYSTESVVQHVFSLLFHAMINVAYYDEEVMSGRWQESDHFTFFDHSIREIKGMTMGIYGYGTIGERVANVANAFGMNVIVTRRTQIQQEKAPITYVDFDTLIENSDVLTLHSSLNLTTKEIFNERVFQKMKKSSILINTARGGLIHESDLAKALNNDEIACACLDVLSHEPPLDNNPLLQAKNCIITPHIAWTSVEARKKLLEGIAKNIHAFINKESLLNVVNL